MQSILLLLIYFCFISCAYSEYKLIDNYNASSFLDMFDFYTDKDPDGGYVIYLSKETAIEEGLFKINNNKIYIGVDQNNKVNETDGFGRKSVLIYSKNHYNNGLFILNLDHMPGSICGTWRMFWFVHGFANRPKYGQMNIIEGINTDSYNVVSLHTDQDCIVNGSAKEFTGKRDTDNCYSSPNNPVGCKIVADQRTSLGDGFNEAGGGVYVVEWTRYLIQVWLFARNNTPADIKSDQPDPTKWGLPIAKFSGSCDFDIDFRDHFITIATSFCSAAWFNSWDDTNKIYCTHKYGDDCNGFVRDNPNAFANSYWLINSLKVYLNFNSSTTTTPIHSTSTTQPPQKHFPTWIYLAIFIPISIIIVIACILFFWCRRRQRQRLESIYALARNGLKLFNNAWTAQKKFDENLWEIKQENLIINKNNLLGSGAFGSVYIARLIGSSGIKRVYSDYISVAHFHDCEVAVKVLPPFASESEKEEFQKEIAFMKMLKYHQNLVGFLGYVASNTISPLLVLEYCANGDLLRFLRQNKDSFIGGDQQTLRPKILVSFSWQISVGLDYFTGLGCIHRDVAARNILLDKDNVCKISDFGLCRTAEDGVYNSRGKRLPIRWAAIESLKSLEFSAKSDVYNLMRSCWQVDSNERPSFAQISQLLAKYLKDVTSDYGYVDANQSNVTLTTDVE